MWHPTESLVAASPMIDWGGPEGPCDGLLGAVSEAGGRWSRSVGREASRLIRQRRTSRRGAGAQGVRCFTRTPGPPPPRALRSDARTRDRPQRSFSRGEGDRRADPSRGAGPPVGGLGGIGVAAGLFRRPPAALKGRPTDCLAPLKGLATDRSTDRSGGSARPAGGGSDPRGVRGAASSDSDERAAGGPAPWVPGVSSGRLDHPPSRALSSDARTRDRPRALVQPR